MAEKPQTEHLYSYNSPPPTYEESKYHQKLEEAPNLSAMDTEYTSQKVCIKKIFGFVEGRKFCSFNLFLHIKLSKHYIEYSLRIFL